MRDLLAEDAGWRSALKLTTAYWAVIAVLLTIRTALAGLPWDVQLTMAASRLATISIATVSCMIIWAGVARLLRWPFGARVAAGGAMTLVAAYGFAVAVNIVPALVLGAARSAAIDATFVQLVPVGGTQLSLRRMALETLEWLPLFLAWGGLAFGLLYSIAVRDREREVQKLQILSHRAQLRALRYEVDPHFLFNALNSVAALVLDRRNEVAENMLLNLSAYFRNTLSLDPTDDITLAREIEFQQQYLEIERRRFEGALRVEIAVPDALGSALVPSFILHPLLENAIKHGRPSGADHALHLRVAARDVAGSLELTVSNWGGGAGATDMPSTGTGLRNVRERLRLRFGDRQLCVAGQEDDRFTARIVIPLERDG